MLNTLITSKTRLKLLVKFFLNASTRSYLRDLESEFGESTNGIRVELNRFEEAGMLVSHFEGNKKIFSANINHPLFKDINSILLKYTGIDQVVQNVLKRLGGLEQAWLVGDFARGRDSGKIEILLVGANINQDYLINLIEKAQGMISRQIVFDLISSGEAKFVSDKYPESLLLYVSNL